MELELYNLQVMIRNESKHMDTAEISHIYVTLSVENRILDGNEKELSIGCEVVALFPLECSPSLNGVFRSIQSQDCVSPL